MNSFDSPSRQVKHELAKRFPQATHVQLVAATRALMHGATPRKAAQILTGKPHVQQR